MATTTAPAARRMPSWAPVIAVLVLALVLVGAFRIFGRITELREIPPIEAIAIERTTLTDEGVDLKIRNDGPDEVTIAQVLINDAYWDFDITNASLGRLETAT